MVVFSAISAINYLRTGSYYQFLTTFTWVDWLLLSLMGIFSSIQFTLYAYALKLDNPVRLSIYTYISPVIQFVFDIVLFNTKFDEI